MRLRISFFAAIAFWPLAALSQPARAQTTISTFSQWNGVNTTGQWGVPNGGSHYPSVGQSFTAPTGETTLDTFSFQIRSGKNGLSNTSYQAHLYAWTGSVITGSALWSSAVLNTGTVGGFTPFSSTPSVSVTPGNQYLFFLTAADVAQTGTPIGEGFLAQLGAGGSAANGYNGGGFFISNQSSFASLSSVPWSSAVNFNSGQVGGDLAFSATFSGATSVPEPGALALLSLGGVAFLSKRRKK